MFLLKYKTNIRKRTLKFSASAIIFPIIIFHSRISKYEFTGNYFGARYEMRPSGINLCGRCQVGWLVGWLVWCLLAGPDLWKRMPLNCSITMIFTCPLLSWCTISSLFRGNNNVVVFPFPFHIFMPLTNMWFIRLQGHFPS